MSRVVFIPIKDNNDKLAKLTTILQSHFEKGQAVHVLAPNPQVIEFVDQLLWRLPAHSFLPHSTSNKELITIGETPNDATIIFNLTPSPLLTSSVKLIYEYEKETHFKTYKDAGFPISTLQ